MLTEKSIITEITTLPLENTIQVKWRNTVEKDGEVISAKDHYRLFGPGQQAEFEAEVEGAANYVNLIDWAIVETWLADGTYAPVEATPSLPGIPQVVTMRQARLAMLGADVLTLANDAIAAMPGVEGEAARIEWEYAHEVRRDAPLVAGMAAALWLSEEQLDDLFAVAATL